MLTAWRRSERNPALAAVAEGMEPTGSFRSLSLAEHNLSLNKAPASLIQELRDAASWSPILKIKGGVSECGKCVCQNVHARA